MKIQPNHFLLVPFLAMLTCASFGAEEKAVGVGAKPIPGAEVILDGSRQMLDALWTYWEGPRFASSLPIKWKIVEDPVDKGTVVSSDDPAAAGGKYGAADIVTKKPHRDFRLHIEFLVMKPGGNSGVYPVVIGRLSAWRLFSGPGHCAGSVFISCGGRHLSVTRP